MGRSGYLMEHLLEIYQTRGTFVFNNTEVRFLLRDMMFYQDYPSPLLPSNKPMSKGRLSKIGFSLELNK